MLEQWPSSVRILNVEAGVYAMERHRDPTDPTWPQKVLDLLATEVWVPVHWTVWKQDFHARFGFYPPEWLEDDWARTHGDPTMCNVLADADGRPVWIDPVPVGHGIPPMRGVDAGKVLQSLAGWERVRGINDTVWAWPNRWPTNTQDAAWWLYVHCLRIQQRSRPGADDWDWADDIQCRVQELLSDWGLPCRR